MKLNYKGFFSSSISTVRYYKDYNDIRKKFSMLGTHTVQITFEATQMGLP